MKTLRLVACCFALSTGAFASQVNVSVRDSEDRAVPQALAEVYFLVSRAVQPRISGYTDRVGLLQAEGRSQFGFQINVQKAGYYSARWQITPAADRLDKTVILPAIKNPIPLFARRVGYWGEKDSDLPAENQWLGYDFQMGDWVAPYGKGAIVDVRFRYRHEFQGYWLSGAKLEEEIVINKEIAVRDKRVWSEEDFKLAAGKWAGELEISFPGEQEGLVEVVDRFLPYSQLKMPHEAPADGYGAGWKYSVNNYSPMGWRDNAGFFLRTRVKLDERGNLVSAHYAKVIGDFRFSPQGRLAFTYYFNPTPNDRNLEFDPNRNLFSKGPAGTEVRDP